MREFENGATRDSDDGKFDYDGFFSPLAIRRYGEYMHAHRIQADGRLRASDNWQQGMTFSVYMKSLWRHFIDSWSLHRGCVVVDPKDGHQISKEEALCGTIFNAFGYLHELERAKAQAAGRLVINGPLFSPEEARKRDLREVQQKRNTKSPTAGVFSLHRNAQGGNPGDQRKEAGKE